MQRFNISVAEQMTDLRNRLVKPVHVKRRCCDNHVAMLALYSANIAHRIYICYIQLRDCADKLFAENLRNAYSVVAHNTCRKAEHLPLNCTADVQRKVCNFIFVDFKPELFFENVSEQPRRRHHVRIFFLDLSEKMVFCRYPVLQTRRHRFKLKHHLSYKKHILS